MQRNDPCPCGSGKKYKKCCLGKPVEASARVQGADAATFLGEARAQLRAGRLEPAMAALRSALQREPRHPEALYLLGRASADLGRHGEAVEHLRAAAAARPRRAEVHAQLAAVLLEHGDLDGALASARRALDFDRRDRLALGTLAACHERANRLDEALAATERALALDPEDPGALLTWARVQRRKGHLAAARKRLESLLERATERDFRARAEGELGQVLDRLGEHDRAFAAFVRAGEEESARPHAARFDRRVLRERIAGYRAGLSRELLERWTHEDFGDGHPRPVFLVGFPRSGTTMLEQVLAAHPRIESSDEKPLLRAVRTALGGLFPGSRDVPSMLADLDLEQARGLRARYWEEVARQVDPRAGAVVVDKNPLDLVELGLVDVLFPEARVIVVRRDPRDTCLSCFMQSFGLNEAMVHFLSLPGTVALYAQVMEFWLELREQLTLRPLEVRYEDAVADLEREGRRMLEYLDLDWDAAVLRFHERARERVISTPSAAAVTEPVHARAVSRWRNYRAHLEPFEGDLAPFLGPLGYA